MIPRTGLTKEIMHNLDLHDTMTPIGIIKVINGTALDLLIDSRDTNHEAQVDTESARKIIMTAHAHKVVFASEIDAHDGMTNIHLLPRPYAICLVSDVAAHNIHLQIESVLDHLNKSRQA